ncbi:MAG: nucleotidyltransferase family protein, partial [Candidatus Entotheonellia bacterium]
TPLRAPSAEEVDWPALLRLAAWHRVVPFLYWGLQRTCPEAVPPSARTGLEAQMRAALGHSLFLTGELLRLLKDLHAQGIPALPFKGPALAGTTVATLAPEDMLLVICAHGSHHHWSRLQWICDVARLVRVHQTLDWDQVLAQARTARGQRMLWLGLRLAQDLLAAPLPPEVAPQVQHDLQTTRLARQVRRRLLEGALDQPPHWQRILFRVHLMPRVPDRLRYVVRALTSPRPEEWTSMPLPDPFFPVYYALRPLRLAGTYGLRAAKHLYTWGQGR